MDGEVKSSRRNAPSGATESCRAWLAALPRVFRQASSEWLADNASRLAAAVAFYTLVALAPVIVIAVALAAVVYGPDATGGRLASEIRGVAGPEAARTIQQIVKGGYQPRMGTIATLLGLATLAFGASSVFLELHEAMNTIWHVSVPRYRNNAATIIRLIGDRFYSFATVLSTGILLLVALLLNSLGSAMRVLVSPAALFVTLWLVVAVLFAALYKIVPNTAVRWSDVAVGAVIASLVFVIGKQLLELYLAHASVGSTYSAAGTPIVVLLWVYYSAQLFFWGAEFTKVYAKSLGSHHKRNIRNA